MTIDRKTLQAPATTTQPLRAFDMPPVPDRVVGVATDSLADIIERGRRAWDQFLPPGRVPLPLMGPMFESQQRGAAGANRTTPREIIFIHPAHE